MRHARKVVIPSSMKGRITPAMLAGLDRFFQLPADLRWTRLPRADGGYSVLLEHPTFPAYAHLDDIPEERWELTPD